MPGWRLWPLEGLLLTLDLLRRQPGVFAKARRELPVEEIDLWFSFHQSLNKQLGFSSWISKTNRRPILAVAPPEYQFVQAVKGLAPKGGPDKVIVLPFYPPNKVPDKSPIGAML